MEVYDRIADIMEYVIMAVFGGIGLLAIIRTYRKAKRGESTSVPTVGVLNDLPSSVTGINKYDDISDRSEERRDRKTEKRDNHGE